MRARAAFAGIPLVALAVFIACSGDESDHSATNENIDSFRDAAADVVQALPDVVTPVDAGDPHLPVAVVSAQSTSCALMGNGDVYCWGFGFFGVLGNGAFDGSTSTPLKVKGLSGPARAISAGVSHVCVIVNDRVECWGSDGEFQVSNDDGHNNGVAKSAIGLPDGKVTSIAAGKSHTCAVIDGKVYCWGNDNSEQAGVPKELFTDGGSHLVQKPTLVAGIDDVRAIVSGPSSDITCALTNGGAVKCWGANLSNFFADAGFSTPQPTAIPTLGSAVAAVANGSESACAVGGEDASARTLRCWGNDVGRNDTGLVSEPVLTALGTDVDFKMASIGAFDSCALAADGSLYCWGENANGNAGDGTETLKRKPTLVLDGGVRFDTVATGETHTCAISGTDVYCWGKNQNGEIGDGIEDAGKRLEPSKVVGLP